MNQQNASFSNNGKVSLRQMSRMMFLEIFGLGTLVLPGPLAKLSQTDGVFAILVAAGIWAAFLRWRHWKPVGQVMEVKHAWADKTKSVVQIILFSAAAGFLMYLVVSLVERQLLGSEYLWIIIFTVLFAGGYGIMKGIESRARIYEILFWILLVPLAVILVIGAWNIHPDYWLPVFASGWLEFFLSVAACLAGFLPAALSILLQPACTEPELVGRMASKTVWRAGVACAFVYLLLLGVFQADLLSVLKYPILSMMSVVQMPGNLLERLDAPMMIIWFFCLFALFHSLCYYGVDGIQKLFPNRKNRGRKVVIGMILILTSALLFLLHGCGKKDPENNMYPLAVGIEYEKDADAMKVAYAYPVTTGGQSGGGQSGSDQSGSQSDGSQSGSNQEGEQSDSSSVPTAGPGYKIITADSLFQAQELLATQSDQTVDLNHMKVFVISREYLHDEEQKEQLFAYFLEHENMAWNTCIIFTEEKLDELFGNDYANGKSLGFYLEDLLKSREDIKEKSVFTVKDYMSLCKNENETMLVPLISIKEDQISIDHYCILSRGGDRGVLAATKADYAKVLMEQQKTLSFLLDKDEYVTLQDIRLERSISLDEDGIPQQKIVVKGNLKLSADWIYNADRKDEILSQAREKLEWELTELIVSTQKDKHADLTNSFIALSGYNRELWKTYRDNPDAYEKKLETTVEVKLKMLDT